MRIADCSLDCIAPRAGVGSVLVIGAEIMSRRIERTPEGKDTAILFGDGAGACRFDPKSGFARIVDSLLCTDGSAAEIPRWKKIGLRWKARA